MWVFVEGRPRRALCAREGEGQRGEGGKRGTGGREFYGVFSRFVKERWGWKGRRKEEERENGRKKTSGDDDEGGR